MSGPEQPGPEEVRRMEARILRLEEAQMYADRAVEQLHEEVLGLGRRVEEVLARIQRLEQRLERAEAEIAQPEDATPDEPGG